MIYLSAQPDEQYFIWQLKVFVQSLVTNQDVSRDNIHILLGYNPAYGLSAEAEYFIEEYQNLASIYFYMDERPSNIYLSTLRPHIIKKHFAEFKFLEGESIFYHDSDIAFTRKMDFSTFLNDRTWYMSDAKSYLNADYIVSKGGDDLLIKMAEIIGIDPQIVYDNNDNTGGAQYIIKGVGVSFWEKVEKDSETLYEFLSKFESKSNLENPIQSWCADMWSILWNAYYFNFVTKTCSELEFCWPLEKSNTWLEKSIYHDAGATHLEDSDGYNVFVKHYFYNTSPFYLDFDKDIHPKTNSYNYVQIFKNLRKIHDLTDSCFCIVINPKNEADYVDITKLIQLINKSFGTYIFVLTFGDEKHLALNGNNVMVKKVNPVNANINYLNNLLLNEFADKFEELNLKYLIFIRPQHRFLPDQILSSVLNHRSNRDQFTIPHNGEVFIVPDEIIPYKIYKEKNHHYTLNTKIDHDFFIVNKDVFLLELDCEDVIGENTNTKIRYERYKKYSRNIINTPLIVSKVVNISTNERVSNLKFYSSIL